jgi:hypothetical protein
VVLESPSGLCQEVRPARSLRSLGSDSGSGEKEARERGERERRERGEMDTRGQEPFTLHAPPDTGLYSLVRSSRSWRARPCSTALSGCPTCLETRVRVKRGRKRERVSVPDQIQKLSLKWPGGHVWPSRPPSLSSEYGTYKTVKALAFR